MRIALVILAARLVIGDQKCGLVPTKVFLSKGEKRQLVFWTDQDYSQASAPVAASSSAAPLSPTTTPETSQVEEVDTFLQAVNGQLPGFGNSKEPEIVTTELDEVTTEKTEIESEDVGNTDNVWADPDIELITTQKPQTTDNTEIKTDVPTTTSRSLEDKALTTVNPNSENEETVTTESRPLAVESTEADADADAVAVAAEEADTEAEEETEEDTTTVAPLDAVPSVQPVVADPVNDVEDGVWTNADGSDDGVVGNLLPQIQAVVSEEETTTIMMDITSESEQVNSQETATLANNPFNDDVSDDETATEKVNTMATLGNEKATTTIRDGETIFESSTLALEISTNADNSEKFIATTKESSQTTETPIHFAKDTDNETPLDTIIEFLSKTTKLPYSPTTVQTTTESTVTIMKQIYNDDVEDDVDTSEYSTLKDDTTTESNPDPTLDYEIQEGTSNIVFPTDAITTVEISKEREETTESMMTKGKTTDEDANNFDKISVVTSISINKVVFEEDDLDIEVVTSSSANIIPSFDDLEVIEDMTTGETIEYAAETTTDTILSTAELLDFDFFGGDNGFIHTDLTTQQSTEETTTQSFEDVAEGKTEQTTNANFETTVNLQGINNQDDDDDATTEGSNISYKITTILPVSENEIQDINIELETTVKPQETTKDVTDDSSTDETNRRYESTTYLPVAENVIQDDDFDFYENIDSLEVAALVANNEIFDETTTGSPIQSFAIEAVESETETIFDDTTTPGPVEFEVVPVNFGDIEAVEADYSDDLHDSNQVFDQTTVGGPELVPVVQAVEAEEEDDDEQKIFDETTTGSPSVSNIPVVEPVVAETEKEFSETTTGSYAENNNIQDDDVDEDHEATTKIMVTSEPKGNTATQETPAMTTAASKNTTTTPLNEIEVSEKVVFPVVKDDMLDVLKEMLLENIDTTTTQIDLETTTTDEYTTDSGTTQEEGETVEVTTMTIEGKITTFAINEQDSTEATTVKIRVGETIVESTSREVIIASDLLEKAQDGEVTTTEKITTKETKTEKPVRESEVVQVQAEGVNGPLVLDEPVYYDDTDDNEVTIEYSEERTETTTESMSTVVDGFIVNKNIVLQTLDNNGIETVRASGEEIKIEITSEIADKTNKDTTTETLTDLDEVMSEEDIASLLVTTSQTRTDEGMEQVTTTKETYTENEGEVERTTTEETKSVTEKGESANETNQTETDPKEKRPPSKYPITDLLNSIYRLVTGIRESSAAEAKAAKAAKGVDTSNSLNSVEIQYFDSPLAKPLNVHNSPREPAPYTTSSARTLTRESVDLANSNTDPFQQLRAPDLTGFIPEGEKEDNVQYIFSSRKQEPARTLSPFNSDALRVEEPPKVLVQEVLEEEEESSSFSLSNLLPSFFSNPAEKVVVAGSLPVTVRDSAQKTRRPIEPASSQGGLLSSLFSRPSTRRPAARPQRPRPMRPDVPAQNPGRFVPVVARQTPPSRQPVSIPLPMQGTEDDNQFNPKIGTFSREESSRLLRFIDTRPLPLRNALVQESRAKREVEEEVNCTWTIQTEKNLYLLVTFHNLSAPFTVDCEGAYIEVERENNGFEARWCGNRVTQGGSRPHVIFARNEVRITVFDDGLEGKTLPTGFNADVEVIDLFDAGQYSSLRKTNAYSSVRKLAGRSLVR